LKTLKGVGFKPQLVFVDPDNRIKEERSTIPVQRAASAANDGS
jgi:hypothetical protein